jgi:hypothetical protein
MRSGSLHAALQRSEPTRKRVRASIQARFPPSRFCTHALSGTVAARASTYPVVTHWIVDTGALRSTESVCKATLMIVVSKTTARMPTISTLAVRVTFLSRRGVTGSMFLAMDAPCLDTWMYLRRE